MRLPDSRVSTQNKHLDPALELGGNFSVRANGSRDFRHARTREERFSTHPNPIRQQWFNQHYHDTNRGGANGCGRFWLGIERVTRPVPTRIKKCFVMFVDFSEFQNRKDPLSLSIVTGEHWCRGERAIYASGKSETYFLNTVGIWNMNIRNTDFLKILFRKVRLSYGLDHLRQDHSKSGLYV